MAADSGYETFDDLTNRMLVGVESFSGSTIVWQALAQDLHGRTLGEGPDDLQMAITDFNTAPELVLTGDLCAGVTSIYNTQGYWLDESITGLYDTQSASQIYEEEYVPGHEGMNSNNFVVTKSWYDEHPEEVAFFLSVWDRGLQEWASNRDAILEAYPEDFGYTSDEELAFLKDWYEKPVQRVRRHRVPGRGVDRRRGTGHRPADLRLEWFRRAPPHHCTHASIQSPARRPALPSS